MNMDMSRNWFLIIGVIGIIAQFLLPDLPAPPEWKPVVHKIPGCLAAINTFLGARAYDLHPSGEKAPIGKVTVEEDHKKSVKVEAIKSPENNN